MLVTGLRTHKVYHTEHKEQEVQNQYYFMEPFTTKPDLYTTDEVTCTLDQSEAPFKSCTVKGTVKGDVTVQDGTKTFSNRFTVQAKGYH